MLRVAHSVPRRLFFVHLGAWHITKNEMSSPCLLCDRSFPNDTALQQHKRDSPVHADSSRCHDCRRSFRSEDALAQHVRDSPAHAKSFDCTDCCRSFTSEDALHQHLRESKAHPRAPETPLDVFFHSFKTFAYDPSQPPATSFAYLQAHKGWRPGDAASAKAWDRYQNALEDEIRLWFGEANDLASWHALCHAIGIEPPPKTCSQCKKVRNLLAWFEVGTLTL